MKTFSIGQRLHLKKSDISRDTDLMIVRAINKVFLLDLTFGTVFGFEYDSLEELEEDVSTWKHIELVK